MNVARYAMRMSTERIVMNVILEIFTKIYRHVKILIKVDKHNGHFTRRHTHTHTHTHTPSSANVDRNSLNIGNRIFFFADRSCRSKRNKFCARYTLPCLEVFQMISALTGITNIFSPYRAVNIVRLTRTS